MDRKYGDFEQVNGAVVNALRQENAALTARVSQLETMAHPPVASVPDAEHLERWLYLINDRLRRIEGRLGLSGWGARPGLFPAPQGFARLDGRPHFVNEFGKEVDEEVLR